METKALARRMAMWQLQETSLHRGQPCRHSEHAGLPCTRSRGRVPSFIYQLLPLPLHHCNAGSAASTTSLPRARPAAPAPSVLIAQAPHKEHAYADADERATNQDKVGPVDYAAAAAAVRSALEGQRGERRAAKDGKNVKGKLTCGPHLTRAKLAFHRVLDHK